MLNRSQEINKNELESQEEKESAFSSAINFFAVDINFYLDIAKAQQIIKKILEQNLIQPLLGRDEKLIQSIGMILEGPFSTKLKLLAIYTLLNTNNKLDNLINTHAKDPNFASGIDKFIMKNFSSDEMELEELRTEFARIIIERNAGWINTLKQIEQPESDDDELTSGNSEFDKSPHM